MASNGSGRGPIKVGSGYIDVYPKLNQEQLRKTRADLEKQMGAAGKASGKALSEGITTQLATIPKKAAEASKAAQKEITKGAQDSKKVLKAIEKEITKAYGEEAGRRFREAAELEKKKQKLLDQTSASTRRALQTTVREEQQAARNAAKAWETAERERIRLIQQREREAEKAARDQAAAERRAQQQIRAEVRQTITEMRRARLAELQGQLDAQRAQATALRNSLRDYRRQMDDHTRAVGRSLTGLQSGWKRQAEAIETLGTNVTEAGRLVTTNLLAPLGAVAGMLTTIGVKSADMRILGQLGLTAAGVSQKTSASEMKKIQQYAIATPFSIDTMHEYQMKLIRSIAGNDKQWYDPKTKAQAANRAAGKTSDIIMAVGDTMARAGNLDPNMFARAMYAVDRIMDMDKAPTRNINQLVQATGIPAGELAQMFGFSSAGAFWKQVGTPVAKGGGISGQDMIDNLLRFWDPKYFVMDPKTGKPKIDPKTRQPIVNREDHSSEDGSKGYGEKMTAATISGRIQQVKEQAQFSLGSLFAKENPKTGEYEYTKLGEAIMGEKTPVYKQDKNGGQYVSGYEYRGGLLNQIQELGRDQKGNIITLIKTSLEAASTFVKQLQSISDWLEKHPEVKKVFADLVKMAAVAMPFIIATGLITKTFGKLNKILAPLVTKPIGAAIKGVVGGTRIVRQVAAGARSRGEGNGFLQGYRDRRTELRGGDVRGPIARTRDRITGEDSGRSQLTRQIRDTEDAIRDTEARMAELQRQIREVNRTSISQLVDQFAGSSVGAGGGSLQGAARTAGTSVNDTQNQIQQLNRASLGDVSREVTGLKETFDDLTKEVKNSKESVGDLAGKKLTELKVNVDSTHGTFTDLKNKIDDTSHSVAVLDGKKLGTVRVQQIEATKTQTEHLKSSLSGAASEVAKLNGKKLSSLRKQITDTTSAAKKLVSAIKDVASRVTALDGKKLTNVKNQFHGGKSSLYNAVNDVYKLVGTTKSGLTGRITTLNGRSLKDITEHVKSLNNALDSASGNAKSLNDHLDSISKHAPGSSGSSNKSSSSKKKRSKATGGVLPGYTPGIDVHRFVSPTGGILDLSGGESVMRPEFTAAMGPEFVNKVNLLARTKGVHGVRQALAPMKFASGGVLSKIGLDGLLNAMDNLSVGEDALAAASTVRMYGSSDGIGGDTRRGIMGSGRQGSLFVGSDIAKKLDGVYSFMTKDIYDLMKKAKVSGGWSQIIGTMAGTLSPISAEYFHDDVWKGNGNILERGSKYLGDLFSWNTLQKAFSNFFSGGWDSIKSLFSGAKSLVTDPIGFVSDGVKGVFELVQSEYNEFVDITKSLGQIWASPEGYAKQVAGDIYETAKEALPNLDGLFDFSGDGLHSASPDFKKMMDDQASTPGVGKGAARWKPQVQMVLAQLGLPLSYTDLVLHRIQVESGGNPNAINLWDSNAKAGYPSQGLMQTIPQTFAAYAGPYKSRGITDPLASIYAGLNYAIHRYGSGWVKALSGTQGYAKGTKGAAPGWAWVGEEGPELVKFSGGETVLNNRDSMLAGGIANRGYASGTENSGLYKAMLGSTSQLNSALSKLRDLLSKAFSADLITKSKHGSLSKWLEKENKDLTSAAKKRADIAQKIKDANQKLTDLKEESAQMAQDISNQASGGTPLAAAFNGGGGVTAASALSGLRSRLSAINTFKANLTKLSKKGYSQAILKEVASAGLDQGNEMAKALLSASSSQVQDITSTYDQIFKASDSLGKSVSDQYYKAGEASIKGLVKGLQSQEDSLDKTIAKMVNKLISTLRKELGVGKGEAVRSDIASIFTWLTGLSQPAKSTTTKKKSTKKKGYWTGTISASPGLALVGERGPELIDFRGGERVYNSQDTESLVGGGGRPIYLTINEAKHETTPQAILRGLQWVDSMYGNRL